MRTTRTRNSLPGTLWPAVLLVLATLGPASEGQAFDTAMICAWQRTFHTHNYVESPLRYYFMPRRPNCDCSGGQPIGWSACQAPLGFDSAGMERLGRIPNDSELGGAAVGAAPGR